VRKTRAPLLLLRLSSLRFLLPSLRDMLQPDD
jgi:hypothetical protein